MTDHEIGPILLPDDIITFTPKAPDGMAFAYQQTDGADLIGQLINDERLGPVRVLFTPSAAQFTALHLWAMVGDLDNLRRQWRDR
jgi:hypothetical protein